MCETCKGWGRTVTRQENPLAVPCPACGRLTWPNLGVNLPSGAAWVLSYSTFWQGRAPGVALETAAREGKG